MKNILLTITFLTLFTSCFDIKNPVKSIPPLDNHAPVASTKTINCDEDKECEITVNATDEDGDELTYHIYSVQTENTVEHVTGNIFKYTPVPNFNGEDTFQFYAKDSKNAYSSQTTVTINVVPEDDVPEVINNYPIGNPLRVTEDTPKIIEILVKENNDGDTRSVSVNQSDTEGVVTNIEYDPINKIIRFLYTPKKDFITSDDSSTFDHFEYTFTETNETSGLSKSISNEIYIKIDNENDPPICDNPTWKPNEDENLSFLIPAIDVDGDILTLVITDGPTSGKIICSTAITCDSNASNCEIDPNYLVAYDNSHCTFVPVPNNTTTQEITYSASDGISTESGRITLDIIDQPDNPYAENFAVYTYLNKTKIINLKGIDPDNQNENLIFHLQANHLKGAWDYNVTTNEFSYTPQDLLPDDDDFISEETFTYRIEDTTGAVSETITVTIQIVPENVFFVKANASTNCPEEERGRSWANAFLHPNDAIDFINSNRDLYGSYSIWVAQGTYTKQTDKSSVLILQPNITLYGGFKGIEYKKQDRDDLNSTSYPSTIDGEELVKHVIQGADNATLDRFHITRGLANGTGSDSHGAGLYFNSEQMTLNDCAFSKNKAIDSGGAIYVTNDSILNLTKTTFTNNTAYRNGGAIYVNIGSKINISQSSFLTNYAGKIDDETKTEGRGGALYLYLNSIVNIDNNTSFTTNTADVAGGAIFSNGNLTIQNSTFNGSSFPIGNTAITGGAIFLANGLSTIDTTTFDHNKSIENGSAIYTLINFTLSNSTVSNNSADFSGTIYCNEKNDIIISKTNFTKNKATKNGGAIYNYKSNITISDDSSFSSNQGENGGAIYNNESSPNITDTTFTSNTAINGGAIYNYGHSNTTLSTSKFLNNLAENGGAVYNYYSRVSYTDTLFRNTNSNNKKGGAIYSMNSDETITECIFHKNIINGVDGYGGALYSNNSDIKILHSNFTQNYGKYGSALYLESDSNSTLLIFNSLISNNVTQPTNTYDSEGHLISTSYPSGACHSIGYTLKIGYSTFYNGTNPKASLYITNLSDYNISNSIIYSDTTLVIEDSSGTATNNVDNADVSISTIDDVIDIKPEYTYTIGPNPDNVKDKAINLDFLTIDEVNSYLDGRIVFEDENSNEERITDIGDYDLGYHYKSNCFITCPEPPPEPEE